MERKKLKGRKSAKYSTHPGIEHSAYRNKNLTGLCKSIGKEREGVWTVKDMNRDP